MAIKTILVHLAFTNVMNIGSLHKRWQHKQKMRVKLPPTSEHENYFHRSLLLIIL